MKKCNIITVIALLTMVIFAETAGAAQFWSYYDSIQKTPSENIFVTQESDDEFILLDTAASSEAKYFVMGKKSYAKLAFDTTGDKLLNKEHETNIAYYLNHTLMESDGLLPESIKKHIDTEHIWNTVRNVNNAQTEKYEFVGGISVMSLDEFNTYYKKIGYRDEVGGDWWLRDALKDWNSSYITKVQTYIPATETDKVGIWIGTPADSYSIRPVFWLDENFFKDTKLNLSKSGDEVKKILAAMPEEELKNVGYSDEEISGLIYGEQFSVVRIENRTNVYDKGSDIYKYTLFSKKGTTYTLKYTVYDVYHEEEVVSKNVSVYAGGGIKKNGVLPYLNELPDGAYDLNLQILRGNAVVYEFTDSFAVLEAYTPQFMDEFSVRDMCFHFDRQGTADRYDAILGMLRDAGCKSVRSDLGWGSVEAVRGTYKEQALERYVHAYEDYGINHMRIPSAYNNTLYAESSSSMMKDKENLQGFTNYLVAASGFEPYAKWLEIFNETDYGGVYAKTFKSDYTNVLKYIYKSVKESNPSQDVLAGAVAQSWLTEPIDGMLRYGIYPYTDAFSIHGYNHPNSITYDFYNDRFHSQQEVINNFGGWKRLYITEVGTTTAKNQSGVTENMSAREVVRSYLLSDIFNIDGTWTYQLLDSGFDPSDSEHCFGMITYDLNAKPGYITYAVMNKKLAGALYLGNVNLGHDIIANVYNKDGKTVIALWNNAEDETVTVNFDDANATVEDIMGKEKGSASEFELGYEINYIHNSDKSWMNKAAYETTLKELEEYEKYPEIAAHGEEMSALKSGAEALKQADADAIKQYLDSVFDFGDRLFETEDISDTRLSQLLFELYNTTRYARALYASYEKNIYNYYDGKEADDAQKLISESVKQNNVYEKPFTNAVFEYAKDAFASAEQIASMKENNPNKNGCISSYKYEAQRLTEWTLKMNEREFGENTDVFMRIMGENQVIYEGVENKLTLDIFNNGVRDFEGTVALYTDDGTLNCRSDKVKSKADTQMSTVLTVSPDYLSDAGKYLIVFENENGETIARQNMELKAEKSLEIELLVSDVPVNKIEKIEVKLKNTSQVAISGNVQITTPDGWTLENNSVNYELPANDSKIYTIGVKDRTNTEYHHYTFTFTATNKKGSLVKEVKLPLNFTCIVQTDPIDIDSFDGDISGWKDAYPIYINPVENPDDIEEWKLSTCSARAFLKWDKDYLYVLCDIYDDAFANGSIGARIWDGDCLQIQVDTLNDKATKYMSDDLEIGYAYTPAGNECYVWQAIGTREAGPRTDSLANIIRDNDQKCTRYLLRISKEEMNYAEITNGMKFGFNIAVNDGDVASRLRYFEFTGGLASSKNPSLAHTFELIGEDSATSAPKLSVFPEKISGKMNK